jgi:hypothetical protein
VRQHILQIEFLYHYDILKPSIKDTLRLKGVSQMNTLGKDNIIFRPMTRERWQNLLRCKEEMEAKGPAILARSS